MDANTSHNKYAPTAWTASSDSLYDYKCPSGQTVQLRKIGMVDLMQAGMLDEMDILGPMMDTNVIQPAGGKGRKPADRQAKRLTKAQQEAKELKAAQDMMKNPDQFKAMGRMMERLIPVVVVQPTVSDPWTKDEAGKFIKLPFPERTEGVIYADSIDFTDQMAIFGEAMGDKSMSDIAAFRDDSESSVDPVEDGGEVPVPTE